MLNNNVDQRCLEKQGLMLNRKQIKKIRLLIKNVLKKLTTKISPNLLAKRWKKTGQVVCTPLMLIENRLKMRKNRRKMRNKVNLGMDISIME